MTAHDRHLPDPNHPSGGETPAPSRFCRAKLSNVVRGFGAATTLTGCATVGNILKTGVWVGVLAVAVVAGIVAITTGMFRR